MLCITFGQSVAPVVFVMLILFQPIFGLPNATVVQEDKSSDVNVSDQVALNVNSILRRGMNTRFEAAKNFNLLEVGEISESTSKENTNKGKTRRPVKQQNFEVQLPVSLRSTLKTVKNLYVDFFSLYLPDSTTVNPECQRDLAALYDGIVSIEDLVKRGILWPLKVVDSWGKGADGVLNGNLKFLGSFHECLNISVKQNEPPEADFRGKYCFIEYHSQTTNTSEFEKMKRSSLKSPYMSVNTPGGISPLDYATCMPSSCSEKELRDSLETNLNHSGYELDVVRCRTKDEKEPFTAGKMFGLGYFTFFGLLLLVASLVDILANHNHSRILNGWLRYILVFSVPHNFRRIFNLETRQNPKMISCLHGLRFLSICWVILGHQYSISFALASNMLEVPELANKPAFQIIANGDLSVDTFFFMSGLLVCLVTLRKLSSEGKFGLIYYYVHRFIRLLPPIIFVVVFVATISGSLVSGPLSWYYEDLYLKGCRARWWLDLTFVGNLFFSTLEGKIPAGEWMSCMPHCWYVDVDLQLYLIAPLLVLPLHFWKKRGPLLLCLWTAVSIIIPASIIGANHLPPSTMITEDPANGEYHKKVYIQPWCRAAPYIMGIWTGYLLHTTNDFPKIPRMGRLQTLLGWTVTTFLAIAVVFGISRYNKSGPVAYLPEMSMVVRVFYGALHRAVWGIVLHRIVLACHWGHGGPINWFLSHPIWQPLSRLTYCIYLTSIPVQLVIICSSVTTSYYSNLSKLQETCGAILIIILVSIPLSLLAETPILRLENLLKQPHMAISQTAQGPETTENLLGRSESTQNLLGRSESTQHLLGRSESAQSHQVSVEDDTPEYVERSGCMERSTQSINITS